MKLLLSLHTPMFGSVHTPKLSEHVPRRISVPETSVGSLHSNVLSAIGQKRLSHVCAAGNGSGGGKLSQSAISRKLRKRPGSLLLSSTRPHGQMQSVLEQLPSRQADPVEHLPMPPTNVHSRLPAVQKPVVGKSSSAKLPHGKFAFCTAEHSRDAHSPNVLPGTVQRATAPSNKRSQPHLNEHEHTWPGPKQRVSAGWLASSVKHVSPLIGSTQSPAPLMVSNVWQ